jgi:two-component system cell cycle response regulator
MNHNRGPDKQMSEDTGSRQRLLIVDDSKVIRVTARKILRDHFETIEAVDGENAWDALNNEGPFSLVVSDLTMPNLDGFGLLERIRNSQRPDIRDIPVIIITGANDSETTKSRAAQAGATDFIGKPFDSVHLLARTQAHANTRAMTNALRQETFKLEEQATNDPLTGLPNEIAFMDRGYQQLSYAIRHKTTLSVSLIEIDDYLELGRQHGNQAAEEIIKSVAKALNAEIRQEDIAARTGTARFGLLLPGMNIAGINNLAERISRSVCTSPVKHGEARINITISIGVATPDIRRDTRLEDLLSEAARHLSLASSRGGNQAVIADSMNDEIELSTPGFAGNTALRTEAIMEMLSGADTTEIEIGVPLALDPGESSPEGLPARECRDTAAPAPLHSRSAGPVSDTQRNIPSGTPVDYSLESGGFFNGKLIQEPTVPQGKAVFAIDDMDNELDETIIITAPFDIHSTADPDDSEGDDWNTGSANMTSAETPAPSATSQKQTSTETLESNLEVLEEIEETTVRTGFFRRLLAAIRSPFGKRKPA